METWRPEDWEYGGEESVREKSATEIMKGIVSFLRARGMRVTTPDRKYFEIRLSDTEWQEIRAGLELEWEKKDYELV